MKFEPTRSAGIARLEEFLPRAGSSYSNDRNYDDGVPAEDFRRNVSQLSPWLRAGLLSEAGVIEAVLTQHSPAAAEKFIAEVFWRIYFKGYLEQRPAIWASYLDERDTALAAIEADAERAETYSQATEGKTGIAAFDHWARELVDTGYLHNHARMWFASIWIFTLRLDWQLGADFFLRHLVDGDAASNTLSWRWVGGLHSKGKTYLARPDNIARYTANQSGGPLTALGLADEAAPLEEAKEFGREELELPPAPQDNVFEQSYALVLHDEAASHVPLTLPSPPALIIGAARPAARSPAPIGEHACTFALGAVENGMDEAGEAFGCETRSWQPGTKLSDILAKTGIERIAVPYLTQGWTRDALMPELAPLLDKGKGIVLLSELDRVAWPHAKAGFFKMRKKIEAILGEVAIPAG